MFAAVGSAMGSPKGEAPSAPGIAKPVNGVVLAANGDAALASDVAKGDGA